ncbi:MAG: SdrD B-like domain-containing protein, partial [Bacteroidota bacterium]
MTESEVFIQVNWPAFSGENQAELYDASNNLLATVCDTNRCFNGQAGSYVATVSIGCVPDGAGYYLILRDGAGDGWDGVNPSITVLDVNNNVLTGPLTLPNGGSVQTPAFSVSGGGTACASCTDGVQNGTETGVDCGGPDCPACVSPTDICVNIFNDYDNDGTDDGTGEVGIAGLTVTAYDAANTPTVFTDNGDGNYLFTPGDAATYRVEVTGVPADLEPSVAGATTLFFTTRGNKISVGLHRPAEYYPEDDVYLSVTCYVDGPNNGTNRTGDVLVVIPAAEFSGGVGNRTPQEDFIATHEEIGATFGVAYSRTAETLFAAAFTKRHTAFGPGGTGAIYEIGLTSTTGTISAGTPSVFL